MPKIITNLENRLVAEAKRQIEASGYGALTIRSIATGCGVGVGTVYNYFSSKDELLAKFLLADWKECLSAIQAASTRSDVPLPVLRCMHSELTGFIRKHQSIFRDAAAAAAFAGTFSRYHAVLRSQLSAPLEKFCVDSFAAEFIAEAVLTWTAAGKPFEAIFGMIEKLI